MNRMASPYKLCHAIANDNVKEVNYLLNVQKVNPGKCAGANALMIACSNNNPDIVKLLITNQRNPADPNMLDSSSGFSPFFSAVNAGNVAMVRVLLQESSVPVNVNAILYGNTPLTMAIHQHNVPLIMVLLKAGEDPNLKLPFNHDQVVDVLVGNIGSALNLSVLLGNLHLDLSRCPLLHKSLQPPP